VPAVHTGALAGRGETMQMDTSCRWRYGRPGIGQFLLVVVTVSATARQIRVVGGVGGGRPYGEAGGDASADQHAEDQSGRATQETHDERRHRATPVGARAHAETAAARGAEGTIRERRTAGQYGADPGRDRLSQGIQLPFHES